MKLQKFMRIIYLVQSIQPRIVLQVRLCRDHSLSFVVKRTSGVLGLVLQFIWAIVIALQYRCRQPVRRADVWVYFLARSLVSRARQRPPQTSCMHRYYMHKLGQFGLR